MKKCLPYVLLALLLSTANSNAHQPEAGKVTASFGPLFYRTYVPSHFKAYPPLRAGFGVLVEGDIDSNGGVEIGAFYMHKDYYREENQQIYAQKAKRIHITMGYRHWFNPYLSASLAFFSAYSMGDPSTIHSDYNLVQNEPTTSAQDTTEYGFDASFIYEILSEDHWALILDARYSHAVTSKAGEEAHHFGLMVGCKLPVEVN